jgi:N-acylneuraminate cytidylyltransferase/CMP-N,N'-diacetyllegionaminic acid synthase
LIKENEDKKYDYFVLLQPTSPLREVKHINKAIEKIIANENVDSLISIKEAEENPYWRVKVNKDKSLKPFLINNIGFTRRQYLPKVYIINGAIYISKCSEFIKNKSFYEGKCLSFIMDKRSNIDIDDVIDFRLAEFLMKKQINKNLEVQNEKM